MTKFRLQEPEAKAGVHDAELTELLHGAKIVEIPPMELLKGRATPMMPCSGRKLIDDVPRLVKEEVPQLAVQPATFNEADLTKVPGVVGRLINWIEAASLYPNRPLALGAALVTVGTLMGQRVANPTAGSTQLFVVGVSSTGSGKQQSIDCAKEALSEVGALDYIGPSDFRSSVALVTTLRIKSVFCSFIDEYGMVLQRIGDKRGGGYEHDIISIMQQLWGHNWTFYNTPASAREPSRRIFAPTFSIFGLSVPEQFYGALSLKQITGGLLNRHLIVRGQDSPSLQRRADNSWRLPAALKVELAGFYKPRLPSQTKEEILEERLDDPSFEPEIRMTWGVGAEQIWTDLVKELRMERDEQRRNLFARVPEMTIRIATIVAFGRHSLTVDQADMKWARALALKSAETLYDGVCRYTVDPQGFAALCNKVVELAASNDGWITTRDLKRRFTTLIAKGGDLDAALKHLVEAERIRVEVRQNPRGGKPSQGYALLKD
jgi:hypothetical protein